MKENTIKIKKMFYSFMKEKAWLEEKALEGYKLRNITLGFIYEFERIEPVRLVYEIDRFNLSSQPTLNEIRQKEQFMEMAQETGWEILTFDESMTYYLCKTYDEQDVNELYNDTESRITRAARFRSNLIAQGQSLIGYAIAINLISFIIFALDGFTVNHGFSKFYMGFNILYSVFVLIWQLICRRLGNDIYHELCMSQKEWQNKFDYSKDNVKKRTKLILRSKSLIKYLDHQAQNGWYLSSAKMFSYTFTHQNPSADAIALPDGRPDSCPAPIHYTIDTRTTVKQRLMQSGLSLKKNYKDIDNQGFEWMEQSVKAARQSGLQYVCAWRKQYIIYCDNNLSSVQAFQSKNIFVSFMSYGLFWYLIACGLIGFLCGLIAGFAGL